MHGGSILETQLKERSDTLAKYDASEEAWKKQLEETSTELSKRVAQPLEQHGGEMDVQEISDQEMDEREKQVQDAIDEAKMQQDKQQREQADAKASELLIVMQKLKGASDKPREGSRTPRRSASKESGGTEGTKGEPGGDKEPPPGKART